MDVIILTHTAIQIFDSIPPESVSCNLSGSLSRMAMARQKTTNAEAPSSNTQELIDASLVES